MRKPTREEKRELLLCCNYASASLDAPWICSSRIREIQKFGGERQRSEGVKWLKRIMKRIDSTAFVPFQEFKARQVIDA